MSPRRVALAWRWPGGRPAVFRWNRNLRQRRQDFRRQRRNRFLQIFPKILFAHRDRRAEIGERVAERDHFAAETLRELADAQLAKVDLCGHSKPLTFYRRFPAAAPSVPPPSVEDAFGGRTLVRAA